MNLIEERRRSRIRQQIRWLRQKHGDGPAQLKINLGTRRVMTKPSHSLQRILIEEIGWEAYEWQRT